MKKLYKSQKRQQNIAKAKGLGFDLRCPHCDYIIDEVRFQSMRFDYGCPRCGESFTSFVPTRILRQPEAVERK